MTLHINEVEHFTIKEAADSGAFLIFLGLLIYYQGQIAWKWCTGPAPWPT